MGPLGYLIVFGHGAAIGVLVLCVAAILVVWFYLSEPLAPISADALLFESVRASTHNVHVKLNNHHHDTSSSRTGDDDGDDQQPPSPWLWFRRTVDRDSGNLVDPFMRVTN
eukprot:TRINITY_DN30_c0_g2_i2.p1 TRINITY_DN30_c0_g2~~TRINITY_DN30_c0_g2_i2.p1  ORF type:complete len:111 (+),score=12.86 TRINITY_DN30_c0_g2_i2:22-354(+)